MNKPVRYTVVDLNGNEDKELEWTEAENIAYERSQYDGLLVIYDNSRAEIACLYYKGHRFISAEHRICEHCQCSLDEHKAHYSYEMTGRWFCSAKCGLAIGALLVPNLESGRKHDS